METTQGISIRVVVSWLGLGLGLGGKPLTLSLTLSLTLTLALALALTPSRTTPSACGASSRWPRSASPPRLTRTTPARARRS